MITLVLIKQLLTSLTTFLLTYWKQSLLGVLLCVTLYYKQSYNNAVAELATFKAEIKTAAAKQESDNAQKVKTANIIADNAQKAYAADIARLGLDRGKLKKELANEKDNITAMLNDAFIMRVNNSSSVREVSKSTSSLAESRGNCDTAITIVKAGQSCAIDYNSLYQAWVDNCKIYECE